MICNLLWVARHVAAVTHCFIATAHLPVITTCHKRAETACDCKLARHSNLRIVRKSSRRLSHKGRQINNLLKVTLISTVGSSCILRGHKLL